MPKCPNCGAKLAEDQHICGTCGYRMESVTRPDPGAGIVAPKTGGGKGLFLAVAVVLMVAFFAVGWHMWATKTKAQTIASETSQVAVKMGEDNSKSQKTSSRDFKAEKSQLQSDSLFQQGIKCLEAKQFSQAELYFEQSAAGGNFEAQAYSGELHESGVLGSPNLSRAYELYQSAAEHGSALGLTKLGKLYESGVEELEIEPDLQHAFSLYEKAANMGDGLGLYLTGECYEQGRGVEADLERAKNCYRLSAVKGYRPAAERLNELEGK